MRRDKGPIIGGYGGYDKAERGKAYDNGSDANQDAGLGQQDTDYETPFGRPVFRSRVREGGLETFGTRECAP
jgi:hypothetical protein